MILKTCANEECNELFEPNVHNAIYCSPECRRICTNKKVLDKYYEKKDKKAQKNRICEADGCATILSMYNEEDICEAHKVERLKNRLEGWGWDREKLDEEWSY